MAPDYRKIYTDLIAKKYPEKAEQFIAFLNKKHFGMMDVIAINNQLTDSQDSDGIFFNQQHRAYDHAAIKEILQYQEVNQLNNIQVATHFKLSRNTVAKWKKLFNRQP